MGRAGYRVLQAADGESALYLSGAPPAVSPRSTPPT